MLNVLIRLFAIVWIVLSYYISISYMDTFLMGRDFIVLVKSTIGLSGVILGMALLFRTFDSAG